MPMLSSQALSPAAHHPLPFLALYHYSRDQADNVYIAVALETKAQFLITGDKNLLTLKKQVENLHILNPRGFVDMMMESLKGEKP